MPTVNGVTSTTDNGTYKLGETIAITVEFSEVVNVTGTPQLTLETGGSDAVVNYSSGTGSNTLTFNYTIGAGHTSGDLDYVATNSLALNSGTIKDAAGNAATLTLASPGAFNSLRANKNLVIDGVVPTVTGVTSTTADDSYRQGETIAIKVAFSEVVNVTGTPQLTLETGGSDAVVNFSSGTGSNTLTFNYTIGSGETSSDLDYVATNSLALNSGTIKDAAGNAATLTLASPGATNSLRDNKALIVDTSVPTINSVSLNAANSELTVTFAENVYDTDGGSGDLEAADFELSISGGVATVDATPTGITKTSQSIWILDLNISGTANGSETLSVVPAAGNAIYDLAGNAASTSQSNNTASLTEKILPTVTNVTSTTSDGSYKQGETIAITVVFSETVNVTGTPQLTLETGGSDAVVDYSSGTASNTLSFNYTIGAGHTSGDLDYVANNSLALNGGTIKDAAGNAATLTLANPGADNSLRANKALIIDTSAPSAFNVGSVVTTGGTVVAGQWNPTNTGIDITVPLANDASLTDGTLQIRANVAGGGYEDLGGAHTILVGELDANKTLSFDAATFEAISGGLSNLENIVFNAIITDKAGNATTGTQSATTITYDQAAPAAFNVGSVITVGGTVVAGQWNPTNTHIDITVPLANDASLTDGTLQIRANVAGGGYEDLGGAHTILVGELDANKTLRFDAATFEAISGGLSNLENIVFNAIITDKASNATTGTQSATTITYDQAAPAAFNVGSVITVGGTVVAGQWNPTNTHIDITVPLANDASLTDGTLQIRANVAGGGYEDLGGAHTILIGELDANKTLRFDAATFEAISGGLSNLENIVFNAIITDKAGNATTGTQSATTITYDEGLHPLPLMWDR